MPEKNTRAIFRPPGAGLSALLPLLIKYTRQYEEPQCWWEVYAYMPSSPPFCLHREQVNYTELRRATGWGYRKHTELQGPLVMPMNNCRQNSIGSMVTLWAWVLHLRPCPLYSVWDPIWSLYTTAVWNARECLPEQKERKLCKDKC